MSVNYVSGSTYQLKKDNAHRVSDKLLSPFRTAFGRKIRVESINGNEIWGRLSFYPRQPSISMRMFAIASFILFAPATIAMTGIGLVVSRFSTTYKNLNHPKARNRHFVLETIFKNLPERAQIERQETQIRTQVERQEAPRVEPAHLPAPIPAPRQAAPAVPYLARPFSFSQDELRREFGLSQKEASVKEVQDNFDAPHSRPTPYTVTNEEMARSPNNYTIFHVENQGHLQELRIKDGKAEFWVDGEERLHQRENTKPFPPAR